MRKEEILAELVAISQDITANITSGWLDSMEDTFQCVTLENIYSNNEDECDSEEVDIEYNNWSARLEALITKLTLSNDGEKFARKCDVTGEGMNEGYCFNDGDSYAKDEESARKFVEGLGYNWEEELSTIDTDEEWFYWTDWNDCEEDWQYVVVNGVLTDIE